MIVTSTARGIACLALAAALVSQADPIGAAPPPTAAATRVIAGRVVGHDGKPMRFAEVRLDKLTITADASGRYRIVAPAAAVWLRFNGVDHATLRVPIIDRGAVALDVTLGTDPRPVQPSSVDAVVMLHGEGGQLKADRHVAMQRQPDGSFVADLEAAGDELLYELAFDGSRHTVNGTQADGFEFDGDDYASRVAPTAGHAAIRFDPRALPPPAQPPRVTFGHGSRAQAEITRLERESRVAPPSAERRSLEPAAWQALLRKRAAEPERLVRDALLVEAFIGPPPTDPTTPDVLIARTIAEVPVDSDAWEVWPDALIILAMRCQDAAARAYAERGARELSDRWRAALVIQTLGLAAGLHGRTDDARRLYRELTTRYADMPPASLAWQFAPDRKVRVGQRLPAFDLASLDDPGVRITPQTLRGKVVLLELWATWCGPCVAEMAGIHEAYEAFHDRGLVIVSINAGESPEVVAAFRKTRWPMPWQHGVSANFGDLEKTLESVGLPNYVLVDASGTIVALRDELRGAKLAKTIERVLGAR
jgi:thiol-disulfide isomerase/thioredoxin